MHQTPSVRQPFVKQLSKEIEASTANLSQIVLLLLAEVLLEDRDLRRHLTEALLPALFLRGRALRQLFLISLDTLEALASFCVLLAGFSKLQLQLAALIAQVTLAGISLMAQVIQVALQAADLVAMSILSTLELELQFLVGILGFDQRLLQWKHL